MSIDCWSDGEIYSFQLLEGNEGFVVRIDGKGLAKLGVEKRAFKTHPQRLTGPFIHPFLEQQLKRLYNQRKR